MAPRTTAAGGGSRSWAAEQRWLDGRVDLDLGHAAFDDQRSGFPRRAKRDLDTVDRPVVRKRFLDERTARRVRAIGLLADQHRVAVDLKDDRIEIGCGELEQRRGAGRL